MAWERRARGGLYYTRSRREGGRVIREYIGGGKSAGLMADMDAVSHSCTQSARAAKRLAQLESEEMLGQVRAFCADVEAVRRAVLCAAGYHQHHRGQWRKRRGPKGDSKMGQTTTKTAANAKPSMNAKNAPLLQPKGELSKPRAEMVALFSRAQKGDEATRDEVRKTLQELQPDIPNGFTPLPSLVKKSLLKKMCGANILFEEDWRLQVESLARKLSGPHPSPLESLLSERISICWLWLHYCETVCAQHLGELLMEQSVFHEKRIEGAQRRYLAAVKSLAQVRRLQLPTVQLNVGQNQVNVAAGQG